MQEQKRKEGNEVRALECFPGHNLLFIVLDSLRYDAAVKALNQGMIPNMSLFLSNGCWEERHTPGNFTWSAHQSFFAGFLPVPAVPGRHARLFAAEFPGSETTGSSTLVFKEANIVHGMASLGYRTICIGGVGFFNKKTELGRQLGALFMEDYWQTEFGVTDPDSTENQVNFAFTLLRNIPDNESLFLFLNVSAIHQPNCYYIPNTENDSVETQMAALAYTDRHLIRLIRAMQMRAPLVLILCSDHGHAYGEDGYYGHRLGHPAVWNVPYAETALSARRPKQSWSQFCDTAPIPFVTYSYSYPHKSTYRSLPEKRSLTNVWANEDRRNLSLYFHIPFCTQKCYYCNLFSVPGAYREIKQQYVDALRRQATAWRQAIDSFSFSQFAIGGGTPSCLDGKQLEELFEIAGNILHASVSEIPVSVEVSPETITREKALLLKQHGTDRLSIGIQSFDDRELRILGRNTTSGEQKKTLDMLREIGFPVLNIDLIYGMEGQTPERWRYSLEEVLRYEPEEIYLYPLYVRPKTVLGQLLGERRQLQEKNPAPDIRDTLRQIGWDVLRDSGYEQISLRYFRRKTLEKGLKSQGISGSRNPDICREQKTDRYEQSDFNCQKLQSPKVVSPEFRCQCDGMFGLGCGARSYTKALHYSFRYSPETEPARLIIQDYIQCTERDFQQVSYGYELDGEDQKRRWIILSLLEYTGLDRDAYRARFGTDPVADIPELTELELHELSITDSRWIRLTDKGMALSDSIGPWLYSEKVNRRMKERL